MKKNRDMKKNRKIRRGLLPAVFAAMAAWTAGCVDDPIEIAPANRVGSDGTVVVNAMLGDMKTTVPTRASGKAKGFENFDVFTNTYGNDAPPVPILIRQWRKVRGSSMWESPVDALYTDKSTVAGSLASYPSDSTFSKYFGQDVSLVVENDGVTYNPFSKWGTTPPEPLTWGGAEDESCFSAWTPVVRTFYRNNATSPKEHLEDWVHMDSQGPDKDGREYGTVKFFRWALDGGSSTRLRDTLYVGWTGNNLASLNNFIGISGQVIDEAADTDVRHTHVPAYMIGNTGGDEKNPPLTYKMNGASVSMRFQHLVSYINIAAINVTRSDGDVVSLGSHWAAVVYFPNLPRYARFTTGDPTKGEAPHLLLTDAEKNSDPHKDTFEKYLKDTILTRKVHPRNGTEPATGWFPDEYTSIVERTGLATYCRTTMYVSPFDLSKPDLGEFVVYVVPKDSTLADKYHSDGRQYYVYEDYSCYKWDADPDLKDISDANDLNHNRTYAIDGRYYGNLSSIAGTISSKKQTLPGYDASSQWLTWLEAGEGLYLSLQLADGKVTGITVSIQGWGDASGGQTETHSRAGIFSANDFNEFCESYWVSGDDYFVPDGMANEKEEIYLYDDLDYTAHTQLEVKMRGDGYKLYGQGHIIKCTDHCTDFHERGDNKNDGNIFDLFIEAPNGSTDSNKKDTTGIFTIFWYDLDGHLQTFHSWDDAIAERNKQLTEKGIS